MNQPKWMKNKHDTNPDAFEESDARSLSKGSTGRTPGSGRLFPGQLDSEVEDFKTDNKVIGRNKDGAFNSRHGYTVSLWFWLQRIAKSKQSNHNFRESLLFSWQGKDDRELQLHLVVVEGEVFEEIYHGYLDLIALTEGKKSIEEVIELRTKLPEENPRWKS